MAYRKDFGVRRRSLSNVGGATSTWGDPEKAKTLAHCLQVNPQTELPLTHGFHTYPARMHPETARRILDAFAPKQETVVVLDPFVGSGTTAVESVRSGYHFIGIDVSHVALEVAWVRTRVMEPAQCRRIEVEGTRLVKQAAKESGPLPAWAQREKDWYSPHTLREIVTLKNLIDGYSDANLRRSLMVVLSSIVVKLSKQVSDSVTVPDKDFKPWPPEATYNLFREKCSELTKMLLLLSSDLYKRGVKFVEPYFRMEDSRTFSMEKSTVDLIVTSPPYPATYDYAAHHARRYPLFGESGSFASEHELASKRELREWPDALRIYRESMEACLRNFLAFLKPKGKMLLLVGDGMVGDHPIFVDRVLRDIAQTLGASATAIASQSRTDWSFGRRGLQKREHLILIEKVPPAPAQRPERGTTARAPGSPRPAPATRPQTPASPATPPPSPGSDPGKSDTGTAPSPSPTPAAPPAPPPTPEPPQTASSTEPTPTPAPPPPPAPGSEASQG